MRAFEMLQCRVVSPGFESESGANTTKPVRVLSVDYSVDCDSALYTVHKAVAIAFVVVAAALPVLVIWIVRRLTGHGHRADSIVSQRVAAELGVSVEDAHEAITNLVDARSFSFMTAGLSSQYLWWEVCCATIALRHVHAAATGTCAPLHGTGTHCAQR